MEELEEESLHLRVLEVVVTGECTMPLYKRWGI